MSIDFPAAVVRRHSGREQGYLGAFLALIVALAPMSVGDTAPMHETLPMQETLVDPTRPSPVVEESNGQYPGAGGGYATPGRRYNLDELLEQLNQSDKLDKLDQLERKLDRLEALTERIDRLNEAQKKIDMLRYLTDDEEMLAEEEVQGVAESSANVWHLSSTVTSPSRTFAVVNGRKVRVGDSVEGARILAIKKGMVELESGSGREILTLSPRMESVPMTVDNGIYHIDASINGSQPIEFMLDTGASSVAISKDIVAWLERTGSITQSDWVGTAEVTVADGKSSEARRFILRSLRLGGIVLRNVEAVELGDSTTPLLGATALRKLGNWRIDQATNRLVLLPQRWRMEQP